MKWSKFNILFQSDDLGYCLFNTRTLSFSKLDKNSFKDLEQISLNTDYSNKLSNDDYKYLIEKKILVEELEDEEFINVLRYRKQLETYSGRDLGLVICPTLNCNFACPYCYEQDLPTQTMPENVQNNLIDFINKYKERFNGLTLNWHGGEPLTAIHTIKEIYEKIEKSSSLPIVRSSMVSNGYLLTENACKFLAQKNLNYLQITIDGNKTTHDKTRILKHGGSTFDRIIQNIDRATELMPNCEIGIRTNIGRTNYNEYVDLFHTLSERWKNKNVHIRHAFIIDHKKHTNAQSLELSTDEKNDFVAQLATEMVIDKTAIYPHLDCGTYTCMDESAFVVDPAGLLYKCWADVGKPKRSIGSLQKGITNNNIVAQYVLASDKFSDSNCMSCSFLPICSGGCNLCRMERNPRSTQEEPCDINERGLIKYLETYFKL